MRSAVIVLLLSLLGVGCIAAESDVASHENADLFVQTCTPWEECVTGSYDMNGSCTCWYSGCASVSSGCETQSDIAIYACEGDCSQIAD